LTDDVKAIEAVAEVRQVKTMVDFSVNITLNLPENCKEQAKIFMDWQGKMIKIVAVENND
jgi:hypothetical protein